MLYKVCQNLLILFRKQLYLKSFFFKKATSYIVSYLSEKKLYYVWTEFQKQLAFIYHIFLLYATEKCCLYTI